MHWSVRRPGQMLIEIVVAMGILVIFIVAFAAFILGGFEGGRLARERMIASYYAAEGTEVARSLLEEDFEAIPAGTYRVDEHLALRQTGSGQLALLQGKYARVVEVAAVHRDEDGAVALQGTPDALAKSIRSTVTWQRRNGFEGRVSHTVFITDWMRPRWLMDIPSDFETGALNATGFSGEDDGGIALGTGGDLLRPEALARFEVPRRVTDVHVDEVNDRLYILTEKDDRGPEFLVYDIANSNRGGKAIGLIQGVELSEAGLKFLFTDDYAYVLTANIDQEIAVVRLSDATIVNGWDIEGEATPRDLAIDPQTHRAYLLMGTEREAVPPVVAQSAPPPPETTSPVRLLLTRLVESIAHAFARIPGITAAFAQGAPTCNGQTATIYVSGGVIVGGPDAGSAYTAGVTTLRGNNVAGGTDVIVGTSGNDIIQGRSGIDIICGGFGDDNIDGGNQNDVIFGEGGNDTITGGVNDDTICGGGDNDNLSGDNGNDSIAGGTGTDTLNGNSGTDICREGETTSTCEDFSSAIATCSVTGDVTAPTVSTLSPTDNATGVSRSTNLVITFSEAVTAVSGNITLKKTIDNSTVETILVTSGQVTGGGTATITINPAANLAEATSFYVQIDATAFDDLAGNGFIGIADTTTWNFTTETCTPSTLPTCNGQTATVYVNDCTEIVGGNDAGSAFTGTLNGSTGNDVMVGTSGADTINGLGGADTICGLGGADIIDGGAGNDTIFGGAGNDTLSGGNNDDILCGEADADGISGGGGADQLAGGAGTDTLNGNAGTDICREGETLSNCEDTTTSIPTCGAADTTNPTISTLSPADNATDVSPTTNLVITFSEAVTAVSGNITIKKTSDNSTVETILVTSGQVTGGGTATITINPSLDLGFSTSYYVQIDATAFDDLSGNGFAGIADTTTWNFTTSAAPDTTAPTISTLSPADEATDVSLHPTLTITFSEAVTAVNGNVTIKKASDNSTVQAISVTSGNLSGSGTATISLSLSVSLSPLTAYYVQIEATAFDDLAGNGFAGIADTTTWNFTTANFDLTAPSIVSLSPADDAVDVANSTSLVITFSEAVTAVSGNVTVKLASDDSTVETVNVTSPQVNGSGSSIITITLSNALGLSVPYYVQIDATAFDDLAGNGFAGIGDTTTWNFTTAAEPVVITKKETREQRIARIARKLYVLDISDPLAQSTSVFENEVGIGDNGLEVEVADGYAYLAAYDTTGEDDFKIVNLSNGQMATCDLPGPETVNDMHIENGVLFMARNKGEEPEFIGYTLNPSDPMNCRGLLTRAVHATDLDDDARDFIFLPDQQLVFVLGRTTTSALQTIDLSGTEAAWVPRVSAADTSMAFRTVSDGLCDALGTVGSYLYAGCRNKNDATVITLFGGKRGSSARYPKGTFTSPPFDSGKTKTAWKDLRWRQMKDTEGTIELRIRTAATLADLKTAAWVGPDGTSASTYTIGTGEPVAIASGSAGRFLQWKAYFDGNWESTPVLEDVIVTFAP